MIRRGQIWWVDFAEPRGSEPGYRHPALVLQRDEVNESRIATVVVCVLTSNRALARAPGNTLLPRRTTGLARDCGAFAAPAGGGSLEDARAPTRAAAASATAPAPA